MRFPAGVMLLVFTAGALVDEWVLMGRHGECTEIQRLHGRLPELAEAADPYGFVKVMQRKGHAASAEEMPGTGGKAVAVRVPERNLAMVFATRDLCAKLSGK